ncbi:hypothetical protein [Pandoraea sp. NPDC087047]|uniref:hypothetical protein n=1 Tax=Pandoraea sp. NPDC087047 TaxID=3364390 RepID=UPI003816BF72
MVEREHVSGENHGGPSGIDRHRRYQAGGHGSHGARLLNGAALNAAMWIASSDDPKTVFNRAVEVYKRLANGLLQTGG